MTAMRRGDFPPMCDNARQGARRRRSVEPALKLLSEASTPIDKGRRLTTSATTAPDSALRFDDNGANLAASLNGLMRRGGFIKREARGH